MKVGFHPSKKSPPAPSPCLSNRSSRAKKSSPSFPALKKQTPSKPALKGKSARSLLPPSCERTQTPQHTSTRNPLRFSPKQRLARSKIKEGKKMSSSENSEN